MKKVLILLPLLLSAACKPEAPAAQGSVLLRSRIKATASVAHNNVLCEVKVRVDGAPAKIFPDGVDTELGPLSAGRHRLDFQSSCNLNVPGSRDWTCELTVKPGESALVVLSDASFVNGVTIRCP